MSGSPFFWLLFFGEAKKSDMSPMDGVYYIQGGKPLNLTNYTSLYFSYVIRATLLTLYNGLVSL